PFPFQLVLAFLLELALAEQPADDSAEELLAFLLALELAFHLELCFKFAVGLARLAPQGAENGLRGTPRQAAEEFLAFVLTLDFLLELWECTALDRAHAHDVGVLSGQWASAVAV